LGRLLPGPGVGTLGLHDPATPFLFEEPVEGSELEFGLGSRRPEEVVQGPSEQLRQPVELLGLEAPAPALVRLPDILDGRTLLVSR